VFRGSCLADTGDKESYSKQQGDDNDDLGENQSNCDEDYSDDGDEGQEGYKPGGYHPVSIGDKFNGGRYTVIEKLGWGHFSTVWMAYDKHAASNNRPEFVALKVQKSAPHYREAALDEIELLNSVTSTLRTPAVIAEAGASFDPCVVLLYDYFDHVGPNGKHMCMTFEMLGENLLKVIKKYDYQGIPIPVVKNMVRQMCVGLDYLHRHCSIIHTDLKPENVLISAAPPTPDMAEVRALIAAGSAAAPKKGKSPKQNQQATSEASAKAGDNMTSEQKKNLKKKMKKKRQQERKKGKDKNGRERKAGKPNVNQETNALKEMIMMELGAIPAEISSEENAEMVEQVAKRYADATKKLTANSSTSAAAAAGQDDSLLLSSPARQMAPGKDDSPREHFVPGATSDIDEDNDLLAPPTWQRPTLFSYLNFSINAEFEGLLHADEMKALVGEEIAAEIIPQAAFVLPKRSQIARLCMVRNDRWRVYSLIIIFCLDCIHGEDVLGIRPFRW
jgi:hypothetical protein